MNRLQIDEKLVSTMPEEDQRLVLKALEQVCQLAVGRKQVASGSHHVMSCQQLRLNWKTFIVLFASRGSLCVASHFSVPGQRCVHTCQARGSSRGSSKERRRRHFGGSNGIILADRREAVALHRDADAPGPAGNALGENLRSSFPSPGMALRCSP